jgi:hypothetical protein
MLHTWRLMIQKIGQHVFMICCESRDCAEWYTSLGRGHDWLTNEILCVLFCSVDLDRVHTNINEGAHKRYDTFEEGRIRINIVPDGTHTITSPLVRAMNSTNQIARYRDNSHNSFPNQNSELFSLPQTRWTLVNVYFFEYCCGTSIESQHFKLVFFNHLNRVEAE